MLLRTPSGALDISAVANLKEMFDRISADKSSTTVQKTGMGQIFRDPVSELESQFVREVVRFFWKSVLPSFYQRIYSRNPMLLLEHTTIRRQPPTESDNYVPWHLDANFYGFGVPLITAWVPFVEVGTTAPGLEFALPQAPLNDADTQLKWSKVPLQDDGRKVISDAELPSFFGCEFQRQSVALKPGDMCVFDQYAVHRTQILRGATQERSAIEFRIADRDELPGDLPVSSHKGRLISWRDRDNGQVRIGFAGSLFDLSG